MEGRNREVRRLWESQGLVVSRLKRVRFGPVFLNSDLPMARWREMTQHEVDVLSAEVGLAPVSLPTLNAKSKDKLERMQRKSSRPVARGERVRSLRPAHAAPTERTSREPRIEGDRPSRPAREEARPGRKPAARPTAGRTESGRGSAVAERPSEMNKRPAKPARPGIGLVDKDGPSGKRRGAPAGSGQRPGFGRRKPE
jgi:23S rRNA pseudouridine2605 synthase